MALCGYNCSPALCGVNTSCVSQIPPSEVVIQPQPVAVTIPGPILSASPEPVAVAQNTPFATGYPYLGYGGYGCYPYPGYGGYGNCYGYGRRCQYGLSSCYYPTYSQRSSYCGPC